MGFPVVSLAGIATCHKRRSPLYNGVMMLRRLAVFALLLLMPAALLLAMPGEPAPLRPADLLREASKASAPVAAVLRDLAVPADEVALADGRRLRVEPVSAYLVPGDAAAHALRVLGPPASEVEVSGTEIVAVRYFETHVLERVDALLKAADAKEGAWAAEKALRATLRFSHSRRRSPTASDNPWAGRQSDLSGRLLEVRRQLLLLLAAGDDLDEALRWADVWLPLYGAESSLGDVVRAVWKRRAEQLAAQGQFAAARAQFDRLDETFPQHPSLDALRRSLSDHAAGLLKTSRGEADGKAVALLEQALAAWPRLPGLRDELEKRKQTYQVLYVAVRDLPEYLSPALAWTDAERIFEGLAQAHHDSTHGSGYRPRLVERLPAGSGVRRMVELRRDVAWSDGQRLTAADVRHTLELLANPPHSDSAVGRLLDTPRLGSNPFQLELVYRQGLLDPWAPWTLKVLPQHARGKALSAADDVDFATQPTGTGPYQLQGKVGSAGRVYLVLRANPQFIRPGVASPGNIREIRFFAWPAGTADPGDPFPQVALDPLSAHRAALAKHGFTDPRTLPIPRVWFLGVNHRNAALANVNVRLALAHAIDRHGLLARHFAVELPAQALSTLNGPFPRGSWANNPAQRVPEELYRPEEARARARLAGKELANVTWTLKYPAGDPRLDAAFKELAEHVAKVLAGADVHVTIRPEPLPPRALQAAVRERQFDLVYHALDLPDRPAVLGALFDPDPRAVGKGGSNFLGYDQDATLERHLSAALHHRAFPMVRTEMQTVHAHLYATMPLIPLWQLPYTIALSSKLQTPDLDPLAVFADITHWKLAR
jgi:ABC-type transport system substrate-binding protein